MKTFSKDGRTWFEHRDGKTYVGFTKAFLDSLDGCWHILPAAGKRVEVKENAPLCAVETNDGLFSVPSPVSGIISVFEHNAMNFPDKIKEGDHVATLVNPKEVVQEEEVPGQLRIDPAWQARIRENLANPNAQAPIDFFANQPAPAAQLVAVAPRRRGENR